jgi:hypothetical protein
MIQREVIYDVTSLSWFPVLCTLEFYWNNVRGLIQNSEIIKLIISLFLNSEIISFISLIYFYYLLLLTRWNIFRSYTELNKYPLYNKQKIQVFFYKYRISVYLVVWTLSYFTSGYRHMFFCLQSSFETSDKFRGLAEELNQRIKSVLAERAKDHTNEWRQFVRNVHVRTQLMINKIKKLLDFTRNYRKNFK